MDEIKDKIKKLWKRKREFIPGETFIPTGFACYDGDEAAAVLESLYSEKLGLSEKGRCFE